MTDVMFWLLLGLIAVLKIRQSGTSGVIRSMMEDIDLANRTASAVDLRLKDAEKRLEILEAEDYGWKSLPSLNRSQTDPSDEAFRPAVVATSSSEIKSSELNVVMRTVFRNGCKIRLCTEGTWWLLEDENDVVVLVNECFSGLCDAIVKERKLWE